MEADERDPSGEDTYPLIPLFSNKKEPPAWRATQSLFRCSSSAPDDSVSQSNSFKSFRNQRSSSDSLQLWSCLGTPGALSERKNPSKQLQSFSGDVRRDFLTKNRISSSEGSNGPPHRASSKWGPELFTLSHNYLAFHFNQLALRDATRVNLNKNRLKHKSLVTRRL